MGIYREETEIEGVSYTITECMLEDGTIHEYILCSEIKENHFVDLRVMEYLGIGRMYSIDGIKVNSSKTDRHHFWRKK